MKYPYVSNKFDSDYYFPTSYSHKVLVFSIRWPEGIRQRSYSHSHGHADDHSKGRDFEMKSQEGLKYFRYLIILFTS